MAIFSAEDSDDSDDSDSEADVEVDRPVIPFSGPTDDAAASRHSSKIRSDQYESKIRESYCCTFACLKKFRLEDIAALLREWDGNTGHRRTKAYNFLKHARTASVYANRPVVTIARMKFNGLLQGKVWVGGKLCSEQIPICYSALKKLTAVSASVWRKVAKSPVLESVVPPYVSLLYLMQLQLSL
jgi:hypothetical protein